MAYEKKTVQEYIAETDDKTVEGFNDNQEDRIASEFGNINSMFHKITDTTPAAGGWENAKHILVPPHFSGKFEVLDAKVKNSNTVWLDANTYVRPNTARTGITIEVPSAFTNLEIRIIIMKI